MKKKITLLFSMALVITGFSQYSRTAVLAQICRADKER